MKNKLKQPTGIVYANYPNLGSCLSKMNAGQLNQRRTNS